MKGAHPKHPPCPVCGKALYKAATKGTQVKTTDPWAFCRNARCGSFTVGIPSQAKAPKATAAPIVKSESALALSSAQPPVVAEVVEAPDAKEIASKARNNKLARLVGPYRRALPAAPVVSLGEEPAAVVKARERIKVLLASAADGEVGFNPAAIGIVLALASQETGNHAAANTLIAEHKLDALFGIQPQEVFPARPAKDLKA